MKVHKKVLPVIWASNKKAWVSKTVFNDFYLKHFIAAVRCEENGLDHKALLVLDNAHRHSTDLENLETDFPVYVVSLSPNRTSLLHGVAFKLFAAYNR